MLNHRCVIFLFCAMSPQMSFGLKSAHSLRLYLGFLIQCDGGCFALGSLQHFFHMLWQCLQAEQAEHVVQELLGCIDVLWLWFIQSTRPQIHVQSMTNFYYCHNCVCHSSDFSDTACKHSTLNQVLNFTDLTLLQK